MSKHAPYYSLSNATDRGAHFGATIGMLGAIAAIAFQSSISFMPALLSAVPFGIIGVPIVGALAGMAIGGPLFAAGNLITRSIPGLSHSLGEDKPPRHLSQQHSAMRSGQYTNVTSPDDFAKMETSGTDTSRADSVERQRIEQMRVAGLS